MITGDGRVRQNFCLGSFELMRLSELRTGLFIVLTALAGGNAGRAV